VAAIVYPALHQIVFRELWENLALDTHHTAVGYFFKYFWAEYVDSRIDHSWSIDILGLLIKQFDSPILVHSDKPVRGWIGHFYEGNSCFDIIIVLVILDHLAKVEVAIDVSIEHKQWVGVTEAALSMS